jgi:hypothetical protein
MPDFSKGLIYTIRTGDDVYVGSTTNFTRRKHQHKCNIYNENNIMKYNLKVYKTIRENNYEWSMKPYKEYPCENNTQLQIEEERIRCELNAELNSQSCGIGLDYTDKKVWHKQYQIINKENKIEYDKQRYIKNKDEIKKNTNNYYYENKDKIAERDKQYRLKNKTKIDERHSKKVKCECGCIVTKGNLSTHKKRKKHLDLMKIINSV